MADNRMRPHQGSGRPGTDTGRHFGMGGGYGQGGPALNYGGDDEPGPYRVSPSKDYAGPHMGAYEARHYRERSEREPQEEPFGRHRLHDEERFTPDRIDRALQGGHAGKGPRNYRRSDARIIEDVSEVLTHDHFLDATNVEVTAEAGTVTLGGEVDSREDKRRAEDLALSVSGVQDVQNNLRIVAGTINTTPVAFGPANDEE